MTTSSEVLYPPLVTFMKYLSLLATAHIYIAPEALLITYKCVPTGVYFRINIKIL